ncbi:hypothetical protein CU098_013642 [Rhizopus stolonifer]|uniref:Cell division control protein 24 OB domain-containing protein n=1 Tax=Rhizopus stolonifer TaxID=4846 RepID=A0A367KX04_RHIST|nr:hypothetical protein CU098_013642 [Rhizopus stolonifer]
MMQSTKIPWSWVATNVARILIEYPTGLTHVILYSILELQWEKNFLKKFKGFDSEFSTIQAVYDCRKADTFLLEVKVTQWVPIPQSTIFKVTVSDAGREMDLLMHPKFSEWIESGFLQNKNLRMVCPPKINSPVKSEDRRLRTALIPPTELLLIMLNREDRVFVQSRFKTKLRDSTDLFWLKIIHTEQTNQEGADIYLSDMSSDAPPIILSLDKQQASLTFIFRRNDYLGLSQPKIVRGDPQPMNPSGTILYYTNQTVIFLMPEVEAQAADLAKINLSSYVSSQGSSLNNSAKDIAERDEENPFNKNGKRMSRYALKIADTTGTIDITLWEEAGYDSRTLRIGQYILLEQLVTSDSHQNEQKRIWYVNGSTVCGTRLYNISSITSLLTTSSFRQLIPLWHAKESKLDHFQIEATIIGWELHSRIKQEEIMYTDKSQDISILPSKHIVTLAHTTCLLPLSATDVECEFCGCPIENELTHIFRPKSAVGLEEEGWIEWILDDGTSTCHAFGGEESLLNYTAHRFSHRKFPYLNMRAQLFALGYRDVLLQTRTDCCSRTYHKRMQ